MLPRGDAVAEVQYVGAGIVEGMKLAATPVLDDMSQRTLSFCSRRPDAGPIRCPRPRRAPAMPCTDRAAIRHGRTKIASSPRAASRTAGAVSSACRTSRGPRCPAKRWGECRCCGGRSRRSAGTRGRRRATSCNRSPVLFRLLRQPAASAVFQKPIACFAAARFRRVR